MNLKEFHNFLYLIYGNHYEIDFTEKKIHMLYNITKIVNNFKNPDNIIFIYNKILKEISDNSDNFYTEYDISKKESQILKNIYDYLKIIKNILLINSNDEILFESYIYIEIMHLKYKKICNETYNKIKNYKLSINNKDPKEFYNELWDEFLNPHKEIIISRKKEYYVNNIVDIDNIRIINKEIVYSYIDFILSKLNYKRNKDIKNYENGIIFLMLINDII